MHLDPLTFAALGAVAQFAAWLDAIAGGGGLLLTVPAMVSAGLDPHSVLATTNLQGSFGTASATTAFARAGYLQASTA